VGRTQIGQFITIKNELIKVLLTFAGNISSDQGETAMPTPNIQVFAEKSEAPSNQPRAFDTSVARGVGRCIKLRRTICGLSKEQLGEKLGIDATEVDAYEQGGKRISARLLLETAKQLRARPSLFFQDQDSYT
jgi:ribosome-binding protein aMBF1 (putative translation factor)